VLYYLLDCCDVLYYLFDYCDVLYCDVFVQGWVDCIVLFILFDNCDVLYCDVLVHLIVVIYCIVMLHVHFVLTIICLSLFFFIHSFNLQGVLTQSFVEDYGSLLHTHTLHTHIDKTFTLEQVSEAHAYIAQGSHKGKIVFTM
jgi:hypothetical protein